MLERHRVNYVVVGGFAAELHGVRMLNMVTPHGEVDLAFQPSGTDGYPDLQRAAVLMSVGAVEVRIASLADVIRSKTAAGRGKDFAALPELHRLAGSTPAGSTSAGSTSAGSTPARGREPATPARTPTVADVVASSFPVPVPVPVPVRGPGRRPAGPGDGAARIAAARKAAADKRQGPPPPAR